MKKITHILLFLSLLPFYILSQQAEYPFQGISFNKVKLTDEFWLPRVETNRNSTIPASFRKCEETGRIQNFVNAATHEGKFLTTFTFDDTDIYKTIEGASFSLSIHPDYQLDKYIDSLITIIANAQEPDGYLYTARTIHPEQPFGWAGKNRWVNESQLSHELYNSGHLFEAAVAHFQATGKRNFLNIAIKNADLLTQVFGPGKRNDAPGHEIVEMGLVRLYRVTGEKKYLELAKFFIDCRGKRTDKNRAYWQDHLPLTQQREAVGHAVRAAYLYSGVADVAALTGNPDYLTAIDSIWENIVNKKLYINGGIGAKSSGESFGSNYELPNKSAYNETCAAIANVYWNFRMFELHGESKYIDVLERSLYNNVLSGVSLNGVNFFYPNPLSAGPDYNRQPWFDCSCCPTNLCRFISSVTGYIYAQHNDDIYVNLFISSTLNLKLKNTNLKIEQNSNLPRNGNVNFVVRPDKKTRFILKIRIPGWAVNQPVPGDLYAYLNAKNPSISLKINGMDFNAKSENGYLIIDRTWKKGDKIEYNLPVEIKRVVANNKVEADRGLVAIERGPLLYCLEATDNQFDINNLIIPDSTSLYLKSENDVLNGTSLIYGQGILIESTADKLGFNNRKVNFKAIPYNVWNNRGATNMRVWLPRNTEGFKLSSNE